MGTRLLTNRGVPEKNARYVAESAVLNEAAGITTHGVCQFYYFDENVGSTINPKTKPSVILDKPAVALIDGNGSFAQLAMKLAVDIAARKAGKYGIAAICVRNTSWLAGISVKLIPLVKKGFFAQLWACSSFKYVAPFGGREAFLGTNPIGLGFPVPGYPPVIADFSTSTIAGGKVKLFIQTGNKLPEKILLDLHGRATDDPSVMKKKGTISLLGGEHFGHKGFGLSLWVEALALMSGSGYEHNRVTGESFVLIAIDPGIFEEMDNYSKEMRQFIKIIKNSKRRPGVKEIRLPGERSQKSLAESKKKGVVLSERMIDRLNNLAVRNGLKMLTEE